MDKEQTKACIEVMQAYVDGKTIQVRRNKSERWTDWVGADWCWGLREFRVKPEPKTISVLTEDGIAVPYVRLSDVESLLK